MLFRSVGTTLNGDINSAIPFTYVPASELPPRIDGVNPGTGPTAGGTTVTITGSGFNGTTQVYFGDKPATNYTVVSNTEIRATTPAGAAGPVDVRVVEGNSTSTAPGGFTYVAPNGGNNGGNPGNGNPGTSNGDGNTGGGDNGTGGATGGNGVIDTAGDRKSVV